MPTKSNYTPEQIAEMSQAYTAKKEYLDTVRANKTALVVGNKVETPAVVTSLREVGNRLTSQIQSRTIDGHLISNTVVSTVQEIDEDFAFKERQLQLDIARMRRKLEGKAKPKCDFDYNKFYNYHASPTIQNRAFSLQEVIKRFNSGIMTDSNENNCSYDTDQPFIDRENYYRLGGLKYTDIAQIPTKYQQIYADSLKEEPLS